MPDYVCPNCGGGWPAHDDTLARECPWCGQALDGSYEYEPRVATVTRSEEDREKGGGPIYRKLVGWLE